MSPLVSIMTPCYNGEKFVGRYLNSVLAQTYDNIEVVIVDDGSTDNTAAIIKSYIPKFESKGYKLIYVWQENGGAASALNQAIPILRGDFISWFDSDDFLLPDSIEKRVKFLQQNPQYDFCIGQMLEVKEDDLSKVTKIYRRIPPPSEQDNLFLDFIMMNGNVMWPNVYMVHRKAFFSAHSTKKIFPARSGQNFQLNVPLAYRFKYGYINEPVCIYVNRSDSHSHTPKNFQQQVERKRQEIEMMTATLKLLNAPNEKELINLAWARRMHEVLKLAIEHGDAILIYDCCRKAQEKRLNIFGADTFDVGFLLANYILPRIELQNKLDAVRKDISKLNDKLKI